MKNSTQTATRPTTLLWTLALTITALLSSLPAFAEFDSIWDNNEYHSVRVDTQIDPEGNADGGAEAGFQVGFGLGLSKIDEIGIIVGHADADEGNRTHVAFWMEENYEAYGPVIPFGGVNIGWGRLSGDQEKDSIYAKVEGGGKYFVCQSCALVATVGFSWALENIYLTDDGPDDKNFEVGLGFRWYY